MASLLNASQDGGSSSAMPGQGELVLSGAIERRPDGIFADPGKGFSAEEFLRSVERVFCSGYYFSGLDYEAFQNLLYRSECCQEGHFLRFASEIREFSPARRALYRGVKIAGGEVAYLFEPVLLESTVDEPVYAPGDDGERQVIGIETRVLAEKTSLDVDEFVADLWSKGVRFGIDVARVQAAIREGRCERVVVARDLPPTDGQDAGIEEQTPELHRDNSPRELPDGRVDLGQFQNRFPQMKQGARLLMKTPRVLGKAGRTVAGNPVEPPLPRDFDLASLAGEGTRIETQDGRDYIVAALDGFLNLDSKTNRISITEKIINRDGVSARTTGNLALAGDQYEEFGEVQEGRAVEGKSLTFHANVFGKVTSTGGDILLEQNLVGGTASNRNGTITVAGLASNAVLQVGRGVIRVKRAENSLLIGDRVEVEWAANCAVLADEIHIDVAAGCAVAGKKIQIGAGAPRSGRETLVSILMPDLSGLERARAKEQDYIGECGEQIASLKAGIERLMEQPELRSYLSVAGKLQRREISLTPEQEGPWRQLGSRLAPALKRISQGRADIKTLEAEIGLARERIAGLDADKARALAGLECRIESVQGDVTVRALVQPLEAPPLRTLAPREIRLRLQSPDSESGILFADSAGAFDWKPG